MNKKMVSFCIPSFNRGEHIFKLVTDILKYNGNDIEVVVLDNCSEDNTVTLLNEITDDRFRLIQNQHNIGGILNILKVLTLGNGEYSFLCLDKDFVDYRNIGTLIEILKSEKRVTVGYCALNIKEKSENIIYPKGFQSVSTMAYLSSHPSGRFYKTEIYKELPLLNQIFTNSVKFGFYLDIINAEMALKGDATIINMPLFYTETEEDCQQQPTHTYKKDDIFFFPSQRLFEYGLYMQNANSLELSSAEKKRIISKLFSNVLISSTFAYKRCMNDLPVCMHYCIDIRKIGFVELLKINYNCSMSFLKMDLSLNLCQKAMICMKAQLIFLYNVVRNI